MFDPFGAIETLRSLAESDSQIRAAAVSESLTDPQGAPDLFSDCDESDCIYIYSKTFST